MNQQPTPTPTKKPKIPHGAVYKGTLWGTVVGFAVSTFVTILVLIFDGFTFNTANMAFITWQIIWFGVLAIAFARLYEVNPRNLSRAIAISAIASCALLLMIGVYRALFCKDVPYSGDDPIIKIRAILNTLIYTAIFAELLLFIIKTDIKAVAIARDGTVGAMLATMVCFDLLILIDFFETDIVLRFAIAFILLSITGIIITFILSVIYKKPTAQRPVPTPPIAQPQSAPAATPLTQPASVPAPSVTSAPNQPVAQPTSASKFDKNALLAALTQKGDYGERECLIIANIFENHFILGQQSKDDITKDLKNSLKIESTAAEQIYDTCINIMVSSVFA